MFDHVYVLSQGRCLYQGAAGQLVSYLAQLELACPKYHNPADYGECNSSALGHISLLTVEPTEPIETPRPY